MPDIHRILCYAVQQHIEYSALSITRQRVPHSSDVGREADRPARQSHGLRDAATLLATKHQGRLTDLKVRGVLCPGSGNVERSDSWKARSQWAEDAIRSGELGPPGEVARGKISICHDVRVCGRREPETSCEREERRGEDVEVPMMKHGHALRV